MNYPDRVTLELSNCCNRRCASCPRRRMTYPQGVMEPRLFDKIINQLLNSTVVVPFFRGESLSHPDFSKMIPKLKRFSKVQLATNGDYLTRQNQDTIVNYCTFISVSLHERLSPTKKLTRFFLEANDYGLETQVSVLDSQVEGCKSSFIQEWNMVDRVRVYETHSQDGFGSVKGPRWNLFCPKPFTDMVVYWDGKVGLCNHDWNNQTLLGDLNMETVREVWTGESYGKVRRLHAYGSKREIPSCTNCDGGGFGELYVKGELIQSL